MTRRANENRSRHAIPSALLAVALLSGTGLDPRFDQPLRSTETPSMTIDGIRQVVTQHLAPESDRNLRSLLSNATRIQLHPWSSGSTLYIHPEPTLHGKARVVWGGSVRLALRF